jgi:hypothetical protein
MKFFLFLFFFALGCPKKSEDTPVYIMPINDPIELEDEDLDDLPEADDTGGYIEEDYLED